MIRHVAIVVPAADEQALIGDCLAALDRAARHLSASMTDPPSVQVVVVLDACRDGTRDVVESFPSVRMASHDARCVGASRALGTATALTDRRSDDVWTAHTDADSTVPVQWLTHMVGAASRGYDLVLGTVAPQAGLPAPVSREWHRLHSSRDGHDHVHGANLGVRASRLYALGGWQDMRTGEDVDLASRAAAAGTRTLRTGSIPVRTSSRIDGRAPAGFSSYLRGLAQAHA